MPLTQEQIDNAALDLQTIEKVVNGIGPDPVPSRLGPTIRQLPALVAEQVAATDASDANADRAEAAAATAVAQAITPPAGAEFAITDKYEHPAMYIDPDGVLYSRNVQHDAINGVRVDDLMRRVNRAPLPAQADYLGVILYGQSKGVGNGAGVSTFAADTPNALMFNANGTAGAGPRAQDGSGTTAQNHAVLVALQEKLNAGSGNGETGLAQFCRMLDNQLQRENGVSLATLGVTLVCSAPGAVNTSLANLSQGSAPYINLLADVQYGVARAAAAGKTYALPAVLFAQGEYDIQFGGTARLAYKNLLKQLVIDLNTDVKALTGQSADVQLIIYQTSMYAGANMNVPLGQQDAAAEDARIVIAMPDYAMIHVSPTNTHYYETGYAVAGSYYARAYKRLVFDGNTTKLALRQSGAIQRTGTILTIPFAVPVAPLVLSDKYFATVANSGFKAINTVGGAENVITAVAVAYDRVRITLTTAQAGTLYYGHDAVWGGNLHDSDVQDSYSFTRRDLGNAALIFDKAFN